MGDHCETKGGVAFCTTTLFCCLLLCLLQPPATTPCTRPTLLPLQPHIYCSFLLRALLTFFRLVEFSFSSSQNERRDAADVADDTKQSSRYVLLQADGSQHTHTHPYPTCTGAADIQRCCCSSVHYSLFFSSFSFLFFFFHKNAMTFVMVCVGCPLSSTVLLHGVLDSSCVCLLAYNVEAGVHFTSLPSWFSNSFFLFIMYQQSAGQQHLLRVSH